MGLFDKLGFTKLKESLTKTREGLLGKVGRLITTKATIDDELLDQMEEILIAADVGVEATGKIIDSIRRRVKEERYSDSAELQHLLRDEIQRQFVNGTTGEDPFALPSV